MFIVQVCVIAFLCLAVAVCVLESAPSHRDRWERSAIAGALIVALTLLSLLGGCVADGPYSFELEFSRCTKSTEDLCDTGFCLEEYENGRELPGGICTIECEGHGDCGVGAACMAYEYELNGKSFAERHCTPTCETDLECDDGWVCDGVCIPAWGSR